MKPAPFAVKEIEKMDYFYIGDSKESGQLTEDGSVNGVSSRLFLGRFRVSMSAGAELNERFLPSCLKFEPTAFSKIKASRRLPFHKRHPGGCLAIPHATS